MFPPFGSDLCWGCYTSTSTTVGRNHFDHVLGENPPVLCTGRTPKRAHSACLELIKHAVATPFCRMTKCTNTPQTSSKWWVHALLLFWISWHHQDTNFQQLLFACPGLNIFPQSHPVLDWTLCTKNAPEVGSHVTHPSFWTLLSLSFLLQKNGQTSQYHRVTTSYLFKSNNKQKVCWLIWLLGCVSKHLNSFFNASQRWAGDSNPSILRSRWSSPPIFGISGIIGTSSLAPQVLDLWIFGTRQIPINKIDANAHIWMIHCIIASNVFTIWVCIHVYTCNLYVYYCISIKK